MTSFDNRRVLLTTGRLFNVTPADELGRAERDSATDLPSTRQCLSQAGFRELQEQDVVVVPVEDEPGAAAGVFQRIADAHINVRYSYLATGNRLVVAAADPEAVIAALRH